MVQHGNRGQWRDLTFDDLRAILEESGFSKWKIDSGRMARSGECKDLADVNRLIDRDRLNVETEDGEIRHYCLAEMAFWQNVEEEWFIQLMGTIQIRQQRKKEDGGDFYMVPHKVCFLRLRHEEKYQRHCEEVERQRKEHRRQMGLAEAERKRKEDERIRAARQAFRDDLVARISGLADVKFGNDDGLVEMVWVFDNGEEIMFGMDGSDLYGATLVVNGMCIGEMRPEGDYR